MFAQARQTNGRILLRDADAAPPSHFGRELTVNGRIETHGTLHIHGAIVGRIDAGRLVIEEGSDVEGDVLAHEVRIAGRFQGRIFAPTVTVEASADVQGRIFHTTITVARGARVDGRMPWRPASFFENLDDIPETQP